MFDVEAEPAEKRSADVAADYADDDVQQNAGTAAADDLAREPAGDAADDDVASQLTAVGVDNARIE